MKILRLTDSVVTNAEADIYVDPLTKHKYFNLAHGTKGPATWKWYAGVDPSYFDKEGVTLVFDRDSYNLAPIYKAGKPVSDKKGNLCYNVIIDNDPSHRKDVVLLWSIPARTYTNVEYSISGSAQEIGLGVFGKSRGINSIIIPAPVVEIFGNCTLTWSAMNSDNVTIMQSITYNHYDTSWDIGSLETLAVNNV